MRIREWRRPYEDQTLVDGRIPSQVRSVTNPAQHDLEALKRQVMNHDAQAGMYVPIVQVQHVLAGTAPSGRKLTSAESFK